jgi:transposase
MMGEQRDNQQRLFYSFNLDEHVPADHLLRGINQFLDLSDLRSYLAPFYSHTGRPSIDPELMIRMLIVGYCFGIRSERRLCEEVHLNLAFTGGFADWDLRTRCPSTRASPRTAMVASGKAMPSAMSLRRSCSVA